jgi:hypothetical protein
MQTKTVTTTASAPATTNAPLVDTEAPSFESSLDIVVSELKSRMASTRPDILSAWGRYAAKGEVESIDRGVTLDAKRIPDLLKAAKARGESRLEAQCESFISASRALTALAKL